MQHSKLLFLVIGILLGHISGFLMFDRQAPGTDQISEIIRSELSILLQQPTSQPIEEVNLSDNPSSNIGQLDKLRFMQEIKQSVHDAVKSELQQHYAESYEYRAYVENLRQEPQLWCNWSERFINWRQLEILGLMSKGNWA